MNKIENAAKDLKYLLNQGYRKKIALKFVGDHYLLEKKDRNFLGRFVFSETICDNRKTKIRNLNSISRKHVLIDGYNVLITVENILKTPQDIIMAQDGFLRDKSAVFGKYRLKDETNDSIKLILNILKKYNPSFVKFYFDKKVSFSGELAKLVTNYLEKSEIPGTAVLSENVDFDLVIEWKEKGGVVATSDGIIIDKINQVIDIPRFILEKTDNTNSID